MKERKMVNKNVLKKEERIYKKRAMKMKENTIEFL